MLTRTPLDEGEQTKGLTEFIQTFIFTLGGLGGGYGLILATRRQKVLEEQTEQGQDQLFNDRLGRGTEMLGHESMAVRVAGVKILEDLVLTSNNKDIIYQIIDKFLHVGAILQRGIEGQIMRWTEDDISKSGRHDIFASVEAMIKVSKETERKIKFQNIGLQYFEFIDHTSKAFSIDAYETSFF